MSPLSLASLTKVKSEWAAAETEILNIKKMKGGKDHHNETAILASLGLMV
jgi:hypothetical protein